MTKIMLPPGKPLQDGVKKYLAELEGYNNLQYPCVLLGVRGYYKGLMGNPSKNDIGIYDDAMFLVTPDGIFTYNANTDPSHEFPETAVLKPGGPYLYKIGLHNMKHPYKALRQWGRVTVLRNGVEYTDTAAAPFYIDIHRGGYGTTSSLGCQTIPPAQYEDFLSTVENKMKKEKQNVIPYFLAENG